MLMKIKTLPFLLAGFSTVFAAICSNGKTVGNAACCQLFPLLADLQENLFDSPCNEPVREVLHLAFHDAMGFSIRGGVGGGSDGSIITFASIETTFPENTALVGVIGWVTPLIARHNFSDGDFLHFAAAVGIATCPGAPRPNFLLGRPQARAPAESGLVPNASDSVTAILARFADVNINPSEVVALLAAHSVAADYDTDPVIPGAPFDTTPGIFDTQIFTEVLLRGVLFPGNGSNVGEVLSPLRGEVRLQSDFEIARDSRTACLWKELVGNQARMQSQFKAAFSSLSVTGQNTAAMVDCSDVIPIPAPVTVPPFFPQGFTSADIEDFCPSVQLPPLSTLPGPAPIVDSA
ncbi:manganese peroxidase isozyme precursor [Crucibulum laeve]|uniref:Peroxidase n=1 Tax=Crucibulum laeve TaxID=68775 RepID=A0A5C3LZX6_9AGAR|nr:manganese peroxidase isozyme precursor [Crucibulum laeve]